MRRECWERFPHHRLERKPLVRDPGMHHGTCVTHVSWCMLGSLIRGHDGGENVPGIPGACTTCNFTYLTRGLWLLPIANGKLYSISQFTWLLVHGFVLICDSVQFKSPSWCYYRWPGLLYAPTNTYIWTVKHTTNIDATLAGHCVQRCVSPDKPTEYDSVHTVTVILWVWSGLQILPCQTTQTSHLEQNP